MEKLRDQIAKDQAEPDVVRVTETRKDNSIVIGDLDYGYYVTDEVSNVDGTHASSSLCIVTTANPDADMNVTGGMILPIMKSDRLFHINTSPGFQTSMGTTPITMHGMTVWMKH